MARPYLRRWLRRMHPHRNVHCPPPGRLAQGRSLTAQAREEPRGLGVSLASDWCHASLRQSDPDRVGFFSSDNAPKETDAHVPNGRV
jgi:hypothetical protein